jgi:transcription elongation factor GreA
MARRNEIEEILSDYKLIDDRDRAGSSKVQLGSTVTIMYIHNNMEMTCTIVGSSEANALENKISNESALAKAVLSKKEGDVSEVKLDNATFTVKIIKVNN